jgi:hypothetical protein
MANLQGVVPPGIMKEIACAVLCCDKKKYPLDKKGNECARLGTKKHSCVLHKMRKEDKQGKMTQENRVKDKSSGTVLQASPRYPSSDPKYIPDLKYGGLAIDLKFPCPDPVTTGKNGSKVQNISDMSKTSDSMLTTKEDGYLNIKDSKHGDVQDVQGYSPKEAKEDVGSCKCEE